MADKELWHDAKLLTKYTARMEALLIQPDMNIKALFASYVPLSLVMCVCVCLWVRLCACDSALARLSEEKCID
jgi:hypothetical protein